MQRFINLTRTSFVVILGSMNNISAELNVFNPTQVTRLEDLDLHKYQRMFMNLILFCPGY